MKNTISKIIGLIILLTYAVLLSGQEDILSSSSHPTLVTDEASLFSSMEREELERMLVDYNDSTSTQIAIITLTNLNGYAIGDYAARLGEKWGVGSKGKDNGVVILIKPRIGNERGEVFIATGYGVEHILTDARIGRIIDNYMIPFLPDDYFGAAKTASSVIIEMLSGEFRADPDADDGDLTGTLLIAGLILILILFAISKSSKNGGNDNFPNDGGSKNNRTPTYFPPIRGFGRSSSGGRPGGGFGGFGGGRFGGGGAGRSF